MNRNRTGKSDLNESGLVQRLRGSLRSLPIQHPHVLLACSGGKDSVALAWLLAEMKRLGLLTFTIAHVHHGQQACADLAVGAVQSIGAELGVPVSIAYLQQKAIDSHPGVGLEEAMRRERYLALARFAVAYSADCIGLGHHQTDQAETILLHLMRGAGIDGLAGMEVWEQRRVPWWEESGATSIGLWRPLLHESVGDVAAIAASSGLSIVEDPSNNDPVYRRNAIRHQLLPLMEQMAPGSTAAIARTADNLASDAVVLEHFTRQNLELLVSVRGLSRKYLVSLPVGLQRRVVRMWINDALPQLELTADRVDAVVGAAERNRGGSIVQIGQEHSIVLRHGTLALNTCEDTIN